MKQLTTLLILIFMGGYSFCQSYRFDLNPKPIDWSKLQTDFEAKNKCEFDLSELVAKSDLTQKTPKCDSVKVVFQYIEPNGDIKSAKGYLIREITEATEQAPSRVLYSDNGFETISAVYGTRKRNVYSNIKIISDSESYSLGNVFGYKIFNWKQ